MACDEDAGNGDGTPGEGLDQVMIGAHSHVRVSGVSKRDGGHREGDGEGQSFHVLPLSVHSNREGLTIGDSEAPMILGTSLTVKGRPGAEAA
jgi:hypothetical protein